MDFLKYFNQYINENEGIGKMPFHVEKSDKAYDYYFKISDVSENERGFRIRIGKFSKTDIIEGAQTNYGVINIEEIDPMDLDSYLVDEIPYKSNEDKKIEISLDELTKISEILGKILDDYLEKNPKVSKLYDEMLENIDMGAEEYSNFAQNTISIWSKGRWNTQEGASKKTIIYTKLAHS